MKIVAVNEAVQEANERLNLLREVLRNRKVNGAATLQSIWPFGPENWKSLPLKFKQRWWKETEYSTIEPSADLWDAVCEALRTNT